MILNMLHCNFFIFYTARSEQLRKGKGKTVVESSESTSDGSSDFEWNFQAEMNVEQGTQQSRGGEGASGFILSSSPDELSDDSGDWSNKEDVGEKARDSNSEGV